VRLCGAVGNAQFAADELVGHAFDHQRQHLNLARRESDVGNVLHARSGGRASPDVVQYLLRHIDAALHDQLKRTDQHRRGRTLGDEPHGALVDRAGDGVTVVLC
jgi:phytoene/squalene synthetase